MRKFDRSQVTHGLQATRNKSALQTFSWVLTFLSIFNVMFILAKKANR